MEKKLFKNKTQMIIYTILFIIIIILFILIGQMDTHREKISDSEQMSMIFKLVPKNNLYEFVDANDVLNILNGKNGIVLFGFSANKWTNYEAKILNDVAKELKIDKLYYYDFLSDRDSSNGTYETIVSKLSVYVPVNDEEIRNIEAPTIIVVKNGSVIAYFDDVSIVKGPVKPEDYYNEIKNDEIYSKYKFALEEYIK